MSDTHDARVLEVARDLVSACRRYLRMGCEMGEAWRAMDRLIFEYYFAATAPSSMRVWPMPTVNGSPCSPGGWSVNADADDVAALVSALGGPLVPQAVRSVGRDGIERMTVSEVYAFPLPPRK